MATIYCPFPHSDLGAVALADTPGLGDFLSGAEERLIATVGQTLDAVLFVRRPPVDRAVVEPADARLHGLTARAIPDIPVKEWTYFVVNKAPENASQIEFFCGELKQRGIHTRLVLPANCNDDKDVSRCLDEILDDIAKNLASLDHQLFQRRGEGINSLASTIAAFAQRAGDALPKATVVAPDQALLGRLFNPVWSNIGTKLGKLLKEYRNKVMENDDEFLLAVNAVFDPDFPNKLPS